MVNIFEQIGNNINQSFRTAQGAVRGALSSELPGFTDINDLPTPVGSQVRQASIESRRQATAVRNMVRWFLPETGIVEMYINPQSIKYDDKKHITEPMRTRGGYIIQYWGEALGTISISGTTGSSGVEGINVLYDIYRNEQVSMDAIALAAQGLLDQQTLQNGTEINSVSDAVSTILGVGVDSLFDEINGVIESGNIRQTSNRPTLASMAFQTEMYWSGWVFRGYFTSMSVTEKADNIGLFNYDINYTVTQKRGLRLNFMPWHRSATNGPSNSDPAFGVPYSYAGLADPIPQSRIDNDERLNRLRFNVGINEALQSSRPISG